MFLAIGKNIFNKEKESSRYFCNADKNMTDPDGIFTLKKLKYFRYCKQSVIYFCLKSLFFRKKSKIKNEKHRSNPFAGERIPHEVLKIFDESFHVGSNLLHYQLY